MCTLTGEIAVFNISTKLLPLLKVNALFPVTHRAPGVTRQRGQAGRRLRVGEELTWNLEFPTIVLEI